MNKSHEIYIMKQEITFLKNEKITYKNNRNIIKKIDARILNVKNQIAILER